MKFYSLVIALICILLFILQQIEGVTSHLVLNQESFYQPWRFLTAIFIHGDLGHLTLNMFGVIFFGLVLEKLEGSNRFLAAFLISGIGANILSVFVYPSSLGASGAVFGIIGYLTIIKPMMPVWAFGLILPLFLAAIAWITGDILRAMYASDNIGHIAHISGVGIGLLIGLKSRFGKNNTNKKQKSEVNISESRMRVWEGRNM